MTCMKMGVDMANLTPIVFALLNCNIQICFATSLLRSDPSLAATPEEMSVSKVQEESVKNTHTLLPDGEMRHAFFNPALRNWRIVPYEMDIDELKFDTRIVGGHEVNIGEYPFQVAIMIHEFGLWCGGVVYSSNIVLTAAHCFFERRTVRLPIDLFAYVFGKNDLRVIEGKSEQLSSAASVKLHPGYSPNTGYNDIAIVKLVDHVCFTKYVQPLRIGTRSSVHRGDADISGWGYTLVKDGHHSASEEMDAAMAYKRVLQQTTVQIIPKEACSKFYADDLGSRGFANHSSMLCAGYKPGGRDACSGDSGGPLVCVDEQGHYLCGIIATGVGCGLPNRPAFYTNITYFYDWILEHAGQPASICTAI